MARKWKPTKANLAKWAKEKAAKLEPLSYEWLEYYGNCPHMFTRQGVCSRCGVGSFIKERRKRG